MSDEEEAGFDEIIALLEELPEDDARRVILNGLKQIESDELEGWDLIVPKASDFTTEYRALVGVGYLRGVENTQFCFYPPFTDYETLACHYALCDAVGKIRGGMPTRREASIFDDRSNTILVFAAHGFTSDGEEILSIWHKAGIQWKSAVVVLKNVLKKYRNDVPTGN